MEDLYKILELKRSATPEEVKAAYRKSCKVNHPDAGGSDEAMGRVNFAYAVLKDSTRRKLYDSTGATDENLIQKEAENRLMQGFVELLRGLRVEHRNIFKELELKVNAELRQIDHKINQTAAQIKKFAMLKRRVKRGDFFLGVFQGLIDGERQKIKQLKVAKQIVVRMGELLDGCEWEVDAAPASDLWGKQPATWQDIFRTNMT